MPMSGWYVFFLIGSLSSPSTTGEFVSIAVVSKFHNVVDAHTAIPIIVIIRLPNSAKRIDGYLIIISEIKTKSFNFSAIKVAAENESLAIRLASAIDFIACLVHYKVFTIRCF